MKILLDANALIWWMHDDVQLGATARRTLADPHNRVLASVVSLWEITIKWRVGKLDAPGSAYSAFLQEEGVELLDVTPQHVAALEPLPFHHRDPFDHLLLAQARVEGAHLLTSDSPMRDYGVPCIDAS